MLRASMLDPRWRRLAYVRLYCNASCIAAIVAGSIVMCGWFFHLESLKSVFQGPESIEINTALGMILVGVSLWLLLPDPPRRNHRLAGSFLAALVASLGAFTLLEHAFRINLFIDQLIIRQSPAVSAYAPGRMSPATAATFLALGLALLLLDRKPWQRLPVAQILSIWGGLVATMTLSGYINKAIAIYRLFSYTQVAVYTALVLFMLSGAIFFARPRTGIAGDIMGRYLGSAMARRFLPAVFIIPLLASWIRVQGQRMGLVGTDLGLAFNGTVNVVMLSALVWFNSRKLNRAEESLEQARKEGDIHYDASLRDDLTGLYNRRGFLTLAEEQLKLACSGRRTLLVVFADLDGLKTINDRFGHSEGDSALKKTAEVLSAVFRDTDIIARLGGDEFAVLALDCSQSGVTRINAHFDKMLRDLNDFESQWKLSISLGAIRVDSEHQFSIGDLLGKADELMYERKRTRLVALGR